jgi:transcription initiation factor TFIID subunit 15
MNTANKCSDPDNFISFCEGQTITNGRQNIAGSCNPIPMGKIPATTNMVSSIITSPTPGEEVSANVTFTVKIQLSNFELGKFTNPTTTYYSAPQDLSPEGNVIGHCHITIQDLGGSFFPTAPLDASTFAFFKGIDDAGDGKGGLSTTVTGGLKAGFYRICTINSAANHQAVTMPVAKRGSQDDCTKFRVIDDGKGTAPASSSVAAASSSAAIGEGATTSIATATATAGNGNTGSGTTVKVSTITKLQTSTVGGSVITITKLQTTKITQKAPAATTRVVKPGNGGGRPSNGGGNSSNGGGKPATGGGKPSNGGGNNNNGGGKPATGGSKPGNGGGTKVITKTITRLSTSSIAGQVTTITSVETTTIKDTTPVVTDVPSADEGTCPAQVTRTVTVTPTVVATPSSSSASTTTPIVAVVTGTPSTSGPGPALLPITDSGDKDRPFKVNGNTFVNKSAAIQRACDIQFNACANAVHSGVLPGPLSTCSTQQSTCNGA